MADEKNQGPVEVQLSELQCLLLEARETKVAKLKENIASAVREKYAAIIATETRNLFDANPLLKGAEAEFNVAINRVLGELKDQIPEGYAVDMMEWERARATATYNPEKAKQRMAQMPQPRPEPVVEATPEPEGPASLEASPPVPDLEEATEPPDDQQPPLEEDAAVE